MRSKVINQFLADVDWGELDYLIADLPPGTGDEILTIAQEMKPDYALIVTTPQEVSVIDAERAINMAKKLEIPFIGVVENMAGFVCPHCGAVAEIFGAGGGEKLAADYDVKFLGSIPIDIDARILSDKGKPIVLEKQNCEVSSVFKSISASIAAHYQKELLSKIFSKKYSTLNEVKMIRLIFVSLLICVASVMAQSHKDYFSGPFNSPQEVTQECLNCHENAATEIMKTNHWTWLNEEFVDANNNKVQMGKKNFINNFCIAVPSNYPRCTSCHIGYGWKDASFDFKVEQNVDCLVCHEQTGTYIKVPTGAGMPDAKVDLLVSAQSVGKTTRKNCGICHFDGGGGTGVKHGDMDNSLYDPKPETDVHMGALGFQCSDCHTTKEHKIMGASHGSMASGQNHIYCTDCHEGEIHENKTINKHLSTVACETCHIPQFAKEEPTKVWWDWSKAGEDRTDIKDKYGKETYSKLKGEFVWAKNVVPTYQWYNG